MSSAQPVISVANLSKEYRIYGNPYHRLVEKLPWVRGPRHQRVSALEDINFAVYSGECMGIVGANGAGKSTLLKVISGTTYPSSGGYTVRGRVASLLELGAGFHMEFSGRENIYMNAAMMGFSRKEAQGKFAEILDFSELHEFIDAPLRTYSSGMVCRLGFSVAVATDPDVLILDEVFAVGDMSFQKKCVDKIWSYKSRGKTLLFCSHSLYDVRQFCDRAIWLKKGRLQMLGDAVEVTNEYATFENQLAASREPVPWQSEGSVEEPLDEPGDLSQHPRILSAELVDPGTGARRNTFAPNDPVAVRVHVRNSVNPEQLTVGVGFTRSDGTLCFCPTTQMDGVSVDFQEGHVTLLLKGVKLLSGEFVVPVWLLDSRGVHIFHEVPTTENLIVQNRTKELGLFLQEHEWRVEPLEPTPASRFGEEGTS
jgi:lipopolysaccharide transport system ATP-binding protein